MPSSSSSSLLDEMKMVEILHPANVSIYAKSANEGQFYSDRLKDLFANNDLWCVQHVTVDVSERWQRHHEVASIKSLSMENHKTQTNNIDAIHCMHDIYNVFVFINNRCKNSMRLTNRLVVISTASAYETLLTLMMKPFILFLFSSHIQTRILLCWHFNLKRDVFMQK